MTYTYAELDEVLAYSPERGGSCLTWKVDIGRGQNKKYPGDTAGTPHNAGYWSVRYKGKAILAHRLVWLLNHGTWPVGHIDHIDGNRANTRIENLRDAINCQADNNQNRKQEYNKTGYRGVSQPRHTKKYRAEIKHHGKPVHLGYFSTPEEAHKAYLEARTNLHTFNPVPREVL